MSRPEIDVLDDQDVAVALERGELRYFEDWDDTPVREQVVSAIRAKLSAPVPSSECARWKALQARHRAWMARTPKPVPPPPKGGRR